MGLSSMSMFHHYVLAGIVPDRGGVIISETDGRTSTQLFSGSDLWYDAGSARDSYANELLRRLLTEAGVSHQDTGVVCVMQEHGCMLSMDISCVKCTCITSSNIHYRVDEINIKYDLDGHDHEVIYGNSNTINAPFTVDMTMDDGPTHFYQKHYGYDPFANLEYR